VNTVYLFLVEKFRCDIRQDSAFTTRDFFSRRKDWYVYSWSELLSATVFIS